jgi:hemerythrin-like domain-containing protein
MVPQFGRGYPSTMIDLPSLQSDPLRHKAEKGLEEDLPSPMDPPEAYAPSNVKVIPYEEMAPALKKLIDDHENFLKVLSALDNALVALKANQWRFTPEISGAMKRFFECHDEEIVVHTRREEKALFPILRERFLTSGEHSPGPNPVTPVEMMEADHARVTQSTALFFNLLGLASRMRDPIDRNLLFEHAFGLGQEIVETMKLHIYKENTTLFPLAQTLLTPKEFTQIQERMSVM